MLAVRPKKNLVDASTLQCFWFHFGPIVKNLGELRDALDTISDELFLYHVNKERNDIAKWVQEVFGDEALATKLIRVRTRRGALTALENHLRAEYL